jgi:hypothetical protein
VASPCTTVLWEAHATKVKHGGDFVLASNSVGMCIGAGVQGAVLVNQTQDTSSGL